jgi:hypothetical protein
MMRLKFRGGTIPQRRKLERENTLPRRRKLISHQRWRRTPGIDCRSSFLRGADEGSHCILESSGAYPWPAHAPSGPELPLLACRQSRHHNMVEERSGKRLRSKLYARLKLLYELHRLLGPAAGSRILSDLISRGNW